MENAVCVTEDVDDLADCFDYYFPSQDEVRPDRDPAVVMSAEQKAHRRKLLVEAVSRHKTKKLGM